MMNSKLTLFLLVVLIFFSTIQSLQKKRSGKIHLQKKHKHLTESNKHQHQHHHKSKWVAPDAIPAELPDIAQTGMHEFSEFLDLYKNHHLTKGEIKIVFRTADQNDDNMISASEWGDFHGLFIQPFEDADGSGDYLLGSNSVLYSVQTGWFKGIQDSFDKNNIDLLIEQFDRWNQNSEINFADYLFLRKAHLAWQECASEESISARNMDCALTITSPARTISSVEGSEAFKLAAIIREGKQSGSSNNLNFVEFLGVAHLYYYFVEFETPFVGSPHIHKRDILRAIEEGALPTTLNSQQVNSIFTHQLEELDFKGFGGSLYAYRLFARFSVAIPGSLALEEWHEVLASTNFNHRLLHLIDSLFMPTQEQVDEAALVRLGRPRSEKDFIVHFLETAKKSHHHRHLPNRHLHHFMRLSRSKKSHYHHRQIGEPVQEDAIFDEDPRNIIYRQFDTTLSGQMSYNDFQRFFKLAWMFQNYDTDDNGLVSSDEMMQGQKNQVQVIPLDNMEYSDHEEMKDWMASHKSTGMSIHAIQWKLHQGFKFLGVRLAKSTENLNHDGYNNLVQEKEFNYKKMFVMAIEDEHIAISKREANPEEHVVGQPTLANKKAAYKTQAKKVVKARSARAAKATKAPKAIKA